jgi:formylglycine-generating enzyme
VIIIFLLTSISYCANFVVEKELRLLQGDITAKRYPYIDSTGYKCSIIKISSDVSGLKFKGKGIVKQTEREEGSYILYVNDLCDSIKTKRYEFDPFCYKIKNKLVPGAAYFIELKTEGEYTKPVKRPSGNPSAHISGQNNASSTGTSDIKMRFDLKFDIPESEIPSLFDFTLVDGGSFSPIISCNSLGPEIQIGDFYLSTYEITQKQFKAVMGYNPSTLKGDNMPVTNINWHEAVLFCNKLSEIEGLQCYYNISYNIGDLRYGSGQTDGTVTANSNSRGYRLPKVSEWEYAAKGGNRSSGYVYSGSNNIEQVAWHYYNSGSKIHEVGLLLENELCLYDMTGNVDEMCDPDDFSMYLTSSKSIKDHSYIIKGGNFNSSLKRSLIPDFKINNRNIMVKCTMNSTGFRIAKSKYYY